MRNKRKGILMASAILGSAAIVSTGFAAWVITITETETVTGNIDVDTVQDQSILLTEVKEDIVVGDKTYKVDNVVVFGAGADTLGASSKKWITPTVTEDLVAKFYIEVQGYSFLDATTPLTAELTEKSASLYANAVNDGYVAALPTPVVNKTPIKTEGNTAIFEITVQFAWGGYFENVNPTNYYNKYEYTVKRSATQASAGKTETTLLDDVKNVLLSTGTSNYAKLADAQFTITVTPKRSTQA